MLSRSLLSLIVPVAILFGAVPASAESRLALVIGQSAYKSVPALPNPANDARAMSQMLTDAGFAVTTASDLSQDEMRARISDFAGQVAAKGADSVALVFYAWHGLQIDGENYLVPVDVDPKREADIPIQAVRLNDILNTLTSVPSRMRIVLLDACRNNPMAPQVASAGPSRGIETGSGLAAPATLGSGSTLGAGTLIAFATAPGQVALDGEGANSPFSAALSRHVGTPGLEVQQML
ncbi:caspase family protein, partial [Cutibacterium acnes]